MAKTFWVSSLGNDGDGETYAAAKTTVAAGLALLSSVGDVLNIVAEDGPYALGTTHTSLAAVAGTSWTNFGYKIQGTDKDGNPSMATLTCQPSTSTGFIQIANVCSYVIVQGLVFNATGASAYGNSQSYVYVTSTNTSTGPVLIRWCSVLGGTASKQRIILQSNVGSAPGPTTLGSVEYCYFENVPGAVLVYGPSGTRQDVEIHHNVFYDAHGYTATTPNKLQMFSAAGAAGASRSIHHNTWVLLEDSGALYMHSFFASALASGLYATTLLLHSNIIAYWSNEALTIPSIFYPANVAATVTNRTVGYNLLKYERTGGAAAQPAAGAGGWYRGYTDPNLADSPEGTDTWPTDVLLNSGVANHSDIFYAPTTPWVWAEPLADGGYSITLPGDFRVKFGVSPNYRTMGLSASVPGATANTYNVTPVVTNRYHQVEANVPLTVSVAGGVAAGATDSDSGPLALVFSVVDNPAHGTLVFQTDGSFVYTPGTDFYGADSFTFRAFDGEAYSNTGTVYITVSVPAGYLDILGFLEPDLRIDFRAFGLLKRNRIVHADVRERRIDQRWREGTSYRMIVGTSATWAVNFGGIEQARNLFMETDYDVTVAINGAAHQLPVSGALALMTEGITSVVITNNSTVNTPTIQLVVTD